VATQLWYHVGSAHEEPDNRGFAHLFEHLMFGATAHLPRGEYERYHHRYGGYENAYTSFDETVYLSEIAPERHARVLEMEADRMVHLIFDAQNLENEKKIVSEELRVSMENDPFSRVMVATLKETLGEHPYARTPGGTREDVAAATLDHGREFYRRYYRPGNAHLVIVGPVDAPRTLQQVRSLFGELPAGDTAPAEVPPVLGWPLPAEVVLREDLPPVETALLAFPLPPADTPDRAALALLRQLLGGGEVDPLDEILVRRRNKAVMAQTVWLQMREGGALVLAAAYLPYRRKATAFRLLEQSLDELSELEWLTEESLASARRTLLRRIHERVYFADQRAEAIGRAQAWLAEARLAFEEADLLERVTREQVAQAFRERLLQVKPVRIYLKPEKVPLHIRLFGWLYPLVSR
jgi:predicted Zn-dependent peptidase